MPRDFERMPTLLCSSSASSLPSSSLSASSSPSSSSSSSASSAGSSSSSSSLLLAHILHAFSLISQPSADLWAICDYCMYVRARTCACAYARRIVGFKGIGSCWNQYVLWLAGSHQMISRTVPCGQYHKTNPITLPAFFFNREVPMWVRGTTSVSSLGVGSQLTPPFMLTCTLQFDAVIVVVPVVRRFQQAIHVLGCWTVSDATSFRSWRELAPSSVGDEACVHVGPWAMGQAGSVATSTPCSARIRCRRHLGYAENESTGTPAGWVARVRGGSRTGRFAVHPKACDETTYES